MYTRVIRQRVGHGAIFTGFLFSLLLGLLSLVPVPASAATGINQQVSYQARLLDSTGAVVPDGTYNMEFKIYQDGDGDLGGGDETLKWTETRTGGNKVTVKNGYFSAMLGFVTPFASNVDWNQDTLWLSTNIGGTGTPSWDGEMDPFRRFGTAAYALNANQLGGLTAAGFLQLAPAAVQVDNSVVSSLFVNKTGASGNILQLQKNGVDVLSVNNSGLATFSNGISISGDTITDFAGNGLAVSANVLTVRLDTTAADGSSTSSVSGLEFVGGELSLIRGCDAGQVLQWDNGNFEWDCATISGGSGYATIQDETTPLTQRATVNFTGAGVSCVDNAGATRTDCTISGGGSSDLQQTYDAGAAGDQLITLDGTQDSIIITNPVASGTGSAFTFQVNQNNTTAAVSVADLVQASNAANAVNITANAIDSETALAVTANALTSGKVLSLSSSATAFTGALAEITLSGSDAANTGSLLKLSNTGTASASTGLFIDHRATGTGNYALRIDDIASDNTPFIVDGDGRVGVGTTSIVGSTERLLQVGSSTNRGNASVYGDIVSQGISDITGLTNIRDVYLYDTTADSDGGRWIDWATTDQLSWYQEALDDGPSDPCVIATDDRCYTKNFPRKAILIVTTDALYIFDAATNDMWMKFSQDSAGWALGVDTNNNPSSVTALNGVVYVGAKGTASGGLYALDFVNDRMWNYDATDRAGADVGISGRNATVTYASDATTSLQLDPVGTSAEWMNINDVAAVSVNSSLSAITIGAATNVIPGQGQSFVALATDSGITIINLAAQKLLQYSDVTADNYESVALTKSGKMYALNSTTDQAEKWDAIDSDKTSEVNGAFTSRWTSAVGPALAVGAVAIQTDSPDALEVVERGSLAESVAAGNSDLIYVGHNLGLTEIHDHTTVTQGWSKFYNTTRQTMMMPNAIDAAIPLDDTSGTVAQDASFNNTDMSYKGTFTLGASGVRGKGVALGNAGYLCSDANADGTCDNDTSFNSTTASFTITMWFKHSTTAPATPDVLYEKCYDTIPTAVTGCVVAYMTTTGTIVGAIDATTTFTQFTTYDVTATSAHTYNDNQWHFLVMSRDNANDMNVYIDGQALNLSSATGQTATVDAASQVMSIGASCSASAACATGTNFWDGSIDDFTFSSGATTVSQLLSAPARRLYNDARPLANKKVITVTDATTATSTTIGDSGEAWIPNEFAGLIVTLTGDTGAGQTRRVTGNTATTLTVAPAFQTTPDTTTDFEVDPEALYGATDTVMGIGITAESPLGEARQMCVGTNNGSDAGGVTCYNHQAGPNLIADVFHGDSEQTDDFAVEWTGTDYDDIRSIDLSGRALIVGSEAHFYSETRDVRLGQGLDYLANQLFNIRGEIIQDGILVTGSLGSEVGFTGGADLAERYVSDESLLPGEVVALKPNNVGAVVKTTAAYQKDMLGIVATQPGIILGPEEDQSYPVALVGRVPVLVTTENGEIKAGDRVTAAATPGYAMKATTAGRVLGAVLDDLVPEKATACPATVAEGVTCGTVTVFVNLVDYTGQNVDFAVRDAESAGLLPTEIIFNPNGGLIADTLDAETRASRTAELANADKILRYLSGRAASSEDSSEVLADRVSAVNVNGANVYAKNITTLNLSAGGLIIDGPSKFTGTAFFSNDVTFAGHFLTNGTKPNLELPTNQDSPTAGTIEGNDTAGKITVNLGQEPTTGPLFTVKFAKPYDQPPQVFLSAVNGSAADLKYYVAPTTDGFSVTTSSPPPPGVTVSFSYWAVR